MDQPLQKLLFFGIYLLHQPFIQQNLQGSHAGCTTNRVAAEGGNVTQDGVVGEGTHGFPPGYESSEGHTSTECLPQQQDVRDNTVLLESPQGPRPPKSGLNFIKDQEAPGIGTLSS